MRVGGGLALQHLDLDVDVAPQSRVGGTGRVEGVAEVGVRGRNRGIGQR